MLTVFVNGLLSGIWLLGAMFPSFMLLLLVVWIYHITKKDEAALEGFMEDFPPEIPTREVPKHRFVPSTIVRPPEVKARKENEDDDDKS